MKTSDYLTSNQLEALNAIQKINNELHDKEGWESHYTLLSITICSYLFFINLNCNTVGSEINIYNSEYDDRIYYEKSDKLETFYSLIKRKFREHKDNINKIKI